MLPIDTVPKFLDTYFVIASLASLSRPQARSNSLGSAQFSGG